MDFIEGLPKSQGKTTIFVVVHRLTKYAHFMSLSHPYTAKDVAQLFLDNVYKLHGLPATILSDRDAIFTSTFWQELFQLQGCPRHWAKWLSLSEWWYNTSCHSSTKTTPFYAVYGQEPPDHNFMTLKTSSVAAVDNWARERATILRMLRENLHQAQHRMKHYADRLRTEREFDVGDWVYLRLQPYQQSSLALQRNMKLAPRFYGSFQVVSRVGKVAYKLQLPDSALIHPVFHVSLLKKKLGHNITANPTLPPVSDDGILQVEPVAVLESVW